jgi:hypothetical protein
MLLSSWNSMKLEIDRWTVHDLSLTPEKTAALWKVIRRHRTLFSDLTRDDPDNFVRAVTAPYTMWLEVRERGVIIGIIWFGDLHLVTEMTAHMAFFDRKPLEKLELCKEIIRWAFHTFPIHRLSVTPPENYSATIRLMQKMGLTLEGTKREAVLLYGIWRNQLLFGITRSEAEAL